MTDTGNLTKGPILKKLILFYLPIVAGTLFQQLYNAVDAFVVSKYVGTDALAAVGGSPAVLSNLIVGFCTALTSGAAVIIAQQFGAGLTKKLEESVKTSYTFFILLGISVGIIAILLSPQMLRLLKTPDEIFSDSLLYQRIFFSGLVFTMVYNMGSGILRAVGNPRYPFICLFVSCGLNIVLDIVFVAVFDWKIAGVAIATVIAQGVSAILVTLKLLLTKDPYRLRLRNKFNFKTFGQMMKIGIPSGLQCSMYGISNLILQAGVNSLGTVVVASWAMSGKIDGVFWAASGAYNTAITTFVGQNFGAGDIDRVKKGAKQGFFFFISLSALISAGILLLGKPLLSILTDDPAVIDTTWKIMLFFVPIYVVWSVIENYNGVLCGMGDVLIPSCISIIGICGVRILWVETVFRTYPFLESLCICYPVTWVIVAVTIFCYYKYRSKKLTASMS